MDIIIFAILLCILLFVPIGSYQITTKIIILIALLAMYYFIHHKKTKEGFSEHMTTQDSEQDSEAIKNVASLYNTGQMTVNNLTATNSINTSGALQCNSLTIGNNALTVDSNGNLVVNGTMIVNGTASINNDLHVYPVDNGATNGHANIVLHPTYIGNPVGPITISSSYGYDNGGSPTPSRSERPRLQILRGPGGMPASEEDMIRGGNSVGYNREDVDLEVGRVFTTATVYPFNHTFNPEYDNTKDDYARVYAEPSTDPTYSLQNNYGLSLIMDTPNREIEAVIGQLGSTGNTVLATGGPVKYQTP